MTVVLREFLQSLAKLESQTESNLETHRRNNDSDRKELKQTQPFKSLSHIFVSLIINSLVSSPHKQKITSDIRPKSYLLNILESSEHNNFLTSIKYVFKDASKDMRNFTWLQKDSNFLYIEICSNLELPLMWLVLIFQSTFTASKDSKPPGWSVYQKPSLSNMI